MRKLTLNNIILGIIPFSVKSEDILDKILSLYTEKGNIEKCMKYKDELFILTTDGMSLSFDIEEVEDVTTNTVEDLLAQWL